VLCRCILAYVSDDGQSIEAVCRFELCHHRQVFPEASSVSIRYVKVDRGRWTAEGRGICSRPECRTVCRFIEEHLPLEFLDLPCVNCGKIVTYKFDIECVRIDHSSFEFAATIKCPTCHRRSTLRRLAESLRRVKRIKISPTSLEIEVE